MTAFVVASGPSATAEQVMEACRKGNPIVAVNSSYKTIAYMADVLYAGDLKWWQANDYAWDFFGIKVSCNGPFPQDFSDHPEVNVCTILPRQVSEKKFIFDPPGTIGAGGNSGFQATNLTAQFGATTIGLIGFDFKHVDGRVHHHEDHDTSKGLGNPGEASLSRWGMILDDQLDLVRSHGIRIINCSPESCLRNYERMTVKEVLAL